MSRLREIATRAQQQLGQTFVEYALVLAAVVVGVLLTVTWAGLTDLMRTAMDAVAGAV